MKRVLRFAVFILVAFVFVISGAEAKTKRKQPAKKPVTVEMTQREEAERAPDGDRERKQVDTTPTPVVPKPIPVSAGRPTELQLKRASSKKFDLRFLPHTPPIQQERAEMPAPVWNPVTVQGTATTPPPTDLGPGGPVSASAPAPPPLNVFEGLDRFNWGAGSPPDTNGDVGPNHYIQTVNSSVGVYRKSDGAQLAAFTFNTFMSQGNFGNLCDTNNFGDPVVLYDTFEDRWIVTDFAFLVDGGGNPVNPSYECFAVSMSGDPVSGGWNFYSVQLTDFFNDYPKLGVWTDGLYMSSNLFPFGGGSFQKARVWAFNKAQMYAGSPTVKVVSFDVGGGDFTVLPANARLQTGTPPAGRPNLFMSTQLFLNAVTVYKFHVDWNHLSLSTFTGPDVPISSTSWPTFAAAIPQPGTAQTLDSLSNRAMMQNQYTNFGGTESLWVSHTVRRQNTSGFAAPRWYQVDVTGGNVNASIPQAATWDPDGANVIHRWGSSLALDRTGNLALGYSTSNATTEFPSIKYAGRLAGDPVNTFSKTEQTFFAGTASQTSINRWGDYAAMTLDPNGCTFWFTTEYANPADQTFNHRWLTKFGSFQFPECTPVGAGGTISGTVTTNPGGNPIAGATVALGARSATTDGSGNYAFNVPAGMYPSMTASRAAFQPASASSIAVTDGNTTTQNFSLTAAPTSSCLTDTTQTDFQSGVLTNVDVTTSPGDVVLLNAPTIDQQNTAGTSTGTGFGTPAWTGQTFIAGISGSLVKADIQLFCNGCGATPPNLTLSVRATAAGLPTGADLTTATVPGSAFASGSTVTYTATFVTPVAITSGTQYALILRPVSAPAGSGYFWIRSSPSTYANGSRVLSADSGSTWSADTTRDYNFKTYVQTGYSPTGNLVSSPKDANPAGGITPIWQTLSWNASTPANTSVKFQIAGSNSVNGPFNFVGPDNTAGTFFTTSPVQLSPQFYNFRFIEYKAILATTNPNATPTLNDVTACFNDADCSAAITITPGAAQVCPNSTGNTASGPAGETSYQWSITNGTITGGATSQTVTFTAGASGNVGLQLNVVEPSGCLKNASTNVPVDVVTQPTISPDGPTTFCSGGSVTLTSSSATGNQWLLNGNPIGGATNQQLVVSAAGDYTVVVSDGTCTSAASATTTVVVNNPPPTPTISADTNGTGTQDQACPEVPLTLHANGATGATSYQWYKDIDLLPGETNATYQATGSATYYVTATVNGCTTPKSAGYVVQNPTPHSPFVSFRGQASTVTTLAICQGSSQIIDSDSATGIHWWKDGVDLGPGGQSLTVTTAGVYTAQLNALGCHSQFGRNVTVTVDAMPPTPTISGDTNGTGTQDQACPEQPLTLHANGATGATSYTWYSDNAVIPNENTSTLVVTYVANISVTATNGTCTTPHSATYVVQNPTPHSPFVSFRGQASTVTTLAICQGTSQIIDSDSATGIHWWKDGVDLGPGSQSLTVTTAGVYTAQLNALGCHSQFGRTVTVTVTPTPSTPTINAGGPTTFCAGGSVTLTSSSASGNQWYLNGNPIGGATNSTYNATASGNYTVVVTASGCPSAASTATTVTVNPIPATPTINAGGPTTFCTGGSVTLTSSSASGNQWYLNGNPIGGATGNTYNATASGDYTVVVTSAASCASAPSAVTTVTVNPNPNATITVPATVGATSTGNVASVANAGAGATYNWSITNGTITAGTGTNSITFTAGSAGTLTLNVTVTHTGCSDAKSANVNVTLAPVTVTAISPVAGKVGGGNPVTITGTGFAAGATVTIGGVAATNVVVVNATTITAKTGAHAAGTVNVTVTNTNTSTGTLTNGFTYLAHQFDPNGDTIVDPSDIFFLIKYLYLSGPAPHGLAGLASGDANGDGVVDPADIFYVVNYLFLGGPQPMSQPERALESSADRGRTVTNAISGAISLGTPVVRGETVVVPVVMTLAPGSATPDAMSLHVQFDADGDVAIRRAGAGAAVQPVFEITRRTDDGAAYLVAFNPASGNLVLDANRSAVVAEIELPRPASRTELTLDPALTMLTDGSGRAKASAASGSLRLRGAVVEGARPDHTQKPERN